MWICGRACLFACILETLIDCQPPRLPKWMLRKGLPGIAPAERCYRAFWWRKGDVFRLLMSLQAVIDGCTWPHQDERAVQQLQGFIHHVTGEGAVLHYGLTFVTWQS